MKAKYIAFAAICAIVLSACESSIEIIPVPGQGKITAYIDNSDTKTAYSEETKFSWVEGDAIRLEVFNAESGVVNHFTNWADASGASVTFSGSNPTDEWPASGFAVYPALDDSGNKTDGIGISLPANLAVTSSGVMSHIPLIGKQDANDIYKYGFKTAVGVLKVSFSDVPVSARQIVLTAIDSDVLAGVFPLDETAAANGYEMSRAKSEGALNSITISFPQQTAGSTFTAYFPVPVGTVHAGATVSLQDANGNAIKTSAPTVRDIPVVRNQLLNITPTPISSEPWVSLGTGKYMDDHGFYYLTGGASLGRSAADYIDVEIQQKEDEPNKFRVKYPYAVATIAEFANPAEYLYITVREDIGPGIVLNDSYRYNNGMDVLMDNPYWGYSILYHNNRVIKYAADGVTPANIQLAQQYGAIAYNDNCSYNPKIEIVFPGSEPMLADHFNYIYYASVAFANGKVVASMDNDVTAIKVVPAASLDEGVAALEAGTSDAIMTFTESGEKALNLATGTNFILVSRVECEGHGYAYIYSDDYVAGQFISIASVSVSNNAGFQDGSLCYDGGGTAALIDGSESTFWHSAYYDRSTTDYYFSSYYTDGKVFCSYADLDATYGIYIDLDLGEGEAVTSFTVEACLRNSYNGHPKHVKVFGSADGTTWGDALADVADLKGEHEIGTWADPIACTAASPVRYIRFAILSNGLDADLTDAANANGNSYTHLAEIRLR